MWCAFWQDDDPYVRKTAAVCVAKLYDINPELVEDRGFLDLLKVGAHSKSVSASKAGSWHVKQSTSMVWQMKLPFLLLEAHCK